MTTLLWAVVLILGGTLMAVTTWAAVVGGIGALSGARFERCPRCGRHGLSQRGVLHPDRCPPQRYSERLAHRWHGWPHGLHPRHH
jgi:hypothetical protein